MLLNHRLKFITNKHYRVLGRLEEGFGVLYVELPTEPTLLTETVTEVRLVDKRFCPWRKESLLISTVATRPSLVKTRKIPAETVDVSMFHPLAVTTSA